MSKGKFLIYNLMACTLLVILSNSAAFFLHPQEVPDCKRRLIQACNKGILQTEMICNLLAQDINETPNSIQPFIMKIWGLDINIREDLICARLMGTKEISNICIEDWLSEDEWYSEFDDLEFHFQIPNSYRTMMHNIKIKLENYLKLKKNLPSSWIKKNEYDCWSNISLKITGFINRVDLSDFLGLNKHATIYVNQVKIEEIKYLNLCYDSFEPFLKLIDSKVSQMMNRAYEEYMNTGKKPINGYK